MNAQTKSTDNKFSSSMQWFDISGCGLYITPELICGRPCILLLDTALIYTKNASLKGTMEVHDFQPVKFEFNPDLPNYLYICFTDTIESSFFYKNFRIPKDKVRLFDAPLLDIQSVFYELAQKHYGFRIDVLIKSSLFLSPNHQNNEVYSSMFGRFKIAHTGFKQNEISYSLEEKNERNLGYLRANNDQDVLFCCEGYIKNAIKSRQNISLNDAIRFAAILFQKGNAEIDVADVKPHQILLVLNIFNMIYIKNMLPGEKSEIENPSYFSERDFFKSICLNSEACPSPPRAIYTDYMANQTSTPAPLAFIMQKLLVSDPSTTINTNILNPMFGYGALTNILSAQGYPIVGFEKDAKKVNLVKTIKYNNTEITACDSLNSNAAFLLKDSKPYKYVICNPPCLISPKKYEYSTDTRNSITVDRTDFIALLKTLTLRADKGRSVFLLSYFTEAHSPYSETQDEDLKELINFIYERYHIEGLTSITSEIYSKALGKISPLLLVIGDKRDRYESSPNNLLKDALANPILNYESLWDWSSYVCYKRSDEYVADKNLYKETDENSQKLIYETDVAVQKPTPPESTDTDDDFGFENKATASTIPSKNVLQQSDSLFEMKGTVIVQDGKDTLNLEVPDEDTKPKETESEQALEGNNDTKKDDGETPATEGTDSTDDPSEPEEDIGVHHGRGLPEGDEDDEPEEPQEPDQPDTPDESDAPNGSNASGESNTSDESDNDDRPHSISQSLRKGHAESEDHSIAKNKGNLFALEQLNKVIRYHSTATLSEPTANVHQSAFSSYLNAKKNLADLITRSFERLDEDGLGLQDTNDTNPLFQYLKTHDVSISVEAFIGAHLKLGHPKSFAQYIKSENLDVIAAAILKQQKGRSILVLDSLGMLTEQAMSAVIQYNRTNNKTTFYLAKDETFIKKLVDTYEFMNEHVFKNKKPLKYVYLHLIENPSAAVEQFDSDTVYILLNKPGGIPTITKSKETDAKLRGNFSVLLDTDLSAVKYNSALVTFLLKAPIFFRSSRFISSDTNLGLCSTLFSEAVYARYFSSSLGKLDEMSCFLLKNRMIEDLSVFQRFEDLSYIHVGHSKDEHNWSAKYDSLSRSYSSTINNIVLLAEQIQKTSSSKVNTLLSQTRNIAMQIFELCMFCISTVPLTYSTFRSVRDQRKPVVVVPQNIEATLFSLLENLRIPVGDSKDDSKFQSFADLNQTIELKKRTLENLGGAYQTQNDEYFVQLRELEDLVAIRNTTAFEYMTYAKNGKESKYPDITSLIAIFFKNCTLGLNENLENYDDLKRIEANIVKEIGALMELPLCITDFMKYELSQNGVKCSEISSKSFSINLNPKSQKWEVNKSSPVFNLLNPEYSKFDIANQFNAGDFDVLFIEADVIDGLDLSAIKTTNNNTSDHLRKRVLFLSYLNKSIDHYLPLIHMVSDSKQSTTPELHFEVQSNPVQKALYQLMIQQLELFNIDSKGTNAKQVDLSYYLTEPGLAVLGEYLDLNPSYQIHFPNLNLKFWNIYNVLDIVNMVDASLQDNIINHLAYFVRQHMDYLRDMKANPFDLFYVSPKAMVEYKNLDQNIMYLNPYLTAQDGVYFSPMKHATLSYVKNSSNSFTIESCRELHKSQSLVEISAIKSVLTSQFNDKSLLKSENVNHADWLERYIHHYTQYMIAVFRDKIINKLQDRYRNWIYTNTTKLNIVTYLKAHFVESGILRVSNTLKDLYIELLMLADAELVKRFESACQVLTFLKVYHKTILAQCEKKQSSPILIPVPSPFNDKTNQLREGFLIRVNFPTSLMLSLSPKAFSISIAYPYKSKPVDLNLEYVLQYPEVIGKQSVLPKFDDAGIACVLKAYHESKFKDLLSKKITEFSPLKISGFTDLDALSGSDHHATIRAFKEKPQEYKLRHMDVLYGNLFDVYYFLRNQIPLTMISFTNDQGLSEHGFVIPSDMNMDKVGIHLIRTTSLDNVAIALKLIESQKNLHHLRSIQWYGEAGLLEVGYLDKAEVELRFIGSETQLQKIFLDENLFEEYPVLEQVEGQKKALSKSSKDKFEFKPLNLNGIDHNQIGNSLIYKLKMPYSMLINMITVITKKHLYDVALIDFGLVIGRDSLTREIAKEHLS